MIIAELQYDLLLFLGRKPSDEEVLKAMNHAYEKLFENYGSANGDAETLEGSIALRFIRVLEEKLSTNDGEILLPVTFRKLASKPLFTVMKDDKKEFISSWEHHPNFLENTDILYRPTTTQKGYSHIAIIGNVLRFKIPIFYKPIGVRIGYLAVPVLTHFEPKWPIPVSLPAQIIFMEYCREYFQPGYLEKFPI